MKAINFSHHYRKLELLENGKTITTIRKHNKGLHVDEIVNITLRKALICQVQIERIEQKQIKHLSAEFLINDTSPHASNRKEALKFINGFYRIPLHEGSYVYVFYLKKIEEDSN